MPYYIEEYKKDEVNKLLRYNVCAECGSELKLFTDYRMGKFYLACSRNWEHNGIAREYTERPELNILTRRQDMVQEHGEKKSTALTKSGVPLSGALTKTQAMEILRLVYPDVPDDQIIRTAMLCRDFQLHPLMKEVYIIPFGQGDKRTWATVLGINATRKMMARMGSFSYIDNTPRVMTEQEQKDIFGEVQEGKIQAITKLRTKGGLKAQGYGHYMLKDSPYGMDKGNTKANMAFIRSERQAFSRLFPDAIPQELEVVDEAYVEGVGKVNEKTGEIIEGEAKEIITVQPEQSEAIPQPEPEPEKLNETPIAKPQIEQLKKKLAEVGMDVAGLGQYCINQRKWEGIKDMKDLKVWQFNDIMKAIEKGKP